MTKPFNNVEAIKDRLYKEAASIYEGYTGKKLNRMEGFDPLVYMLLGACANEFKKVSWDIESSWSRMLQHIAQLLTPEVHTLVQPASGIAHAYPTFHQVETDAQKDQFLCENFSGNSVYFSPSGIFPLQQARVTTMISGSSLFQISEDLIKEELIRAKTGKALPASTLWLGIQFDFSPNTPIDLPIFFDWAANSTSAKSKSILNGTRCLLNEMPLPISIGISSNNTLHFNQQTLHTARNYERETNLLYNDFFLTLTDLDVAANLTNYPAILSTYFDKNELDKTLKQPLLWLQLEFPSSAFEQQQTAQEALLNLNCVLNCFPVLNRRLHTPSFSLNKHINFFPLPSSGYFFGIEEVFSSRLKKQYQERPFTEIRLKEEPLDPKMQTRTYAIRKQGVNRFNQSDAVDMIDNLVRTIREESFLFSAFSKEMLSQNLKQIRKSLNDMEEKVYQLKKETPDRQRSNFFIAFPPSLKEQIIVQFWSSDGFLGNNIPAGKALQLHGSSAIDGSRLKLVMGTKGGQNPVEEEQKVQRYKTALVVRDKIVTKEDIRLYCLQELGNNVQKITINKGTQIAENPREGFLRTLNVAIQMNPNSGQAESEITFLAKRLEVGLNEKSTAILPIQVQIN